MSINRQNFVGGSEVAALFGLHPRLTKFELYHRKLGNIPDADLSDNDRVQAGIHLEPAIAAWVVERTGWNLRKVHRHIVHPKTPQFGGHLDYEVVAHDKGPGVVEIKTVDRMIFRDWPEGEPPIHYQLQLQSYLAITGRAWGALVALVGGNDLKIWEFDARPKTIEKIESAVAEFWRDVTDKREPKPDFLADAKAISALHSDAGGGIADLAGDNRIPELCANYLAAAADEKDAAERKAAAKSEILTKIGVADKGVCGEFTISATAVKATEPKIITPDMIGQSIGGRAGYRNIKITPRKGV